MVTNLLQHDLAAYKTLPLNGFEKVAIINSVLKPAGPTAACSWATDNKWRSGTTYYYSSSGKPVE